MTLTQKTQKETNKKTPAQIYGLLIYLLFISYIPIFLSPKNSTKEFMLSQNFDYPKLGIKKIIMKKKHYQEKNI